jgi:hypothetical protein
MKVMIANKYQPFITMSQQEAKETFLSKYQLFKTNKQ